MNAFCKWETSASGDEQQVEKVQNRRSRWQYVGKSCGKGRERKLNILTITCLQFDFYICFGLIMLYSASAYNSQAANNGDGMYLFRRQAMVTAGSFVVMLVISKIDYHLYAPFAKIIYYISIFLMVLVRWSPLGLEANGSKRWLGIKDTPFQMQPSEVAKIAVIIFIPYIICQLGKYLKTSAGMTRVLVYWRICFVQRIFLYR